MRKGNIFSATAIATLFVLGPLACWADSEASLQASGESGASNRQGSYAGSENSASADNLQSSHAGQSSMSNSTVEAGDMGNENARNLSASGDMVKAQENARKKAAVPQVPSAKVARYNWHGNGHSRRANRSYMVNTIHQAARTR
jgi:hypothetical protein